MSTSTATVSPAQQNEAVRRPDWVIEAAEPVRLDPGAAFRRQVVERVENGEAVTYRVDRRGAVINRRLERAGLPVSIALGAHAFRGVAARAMENAAGEVTVTLELHHDDPRLCVPLLVASDLYDVAADWRGWAELFALPMLMVEADGAVVALEETLGQLRTNEAIDRRRPRSTRRPRFLARRKPGGLGCSMVVEGEEIIARD